MTEQQHPITPPPELVQQLADGSRTWLDAITDAYRAGADQELEACCAHIHTVHGMHRAVWLRSMRRPKPPSLKEQALKELAWVDKHLKGKAPLSNHCDAIHAIRCALEQLDD